METKQWTTVDKAGWGDGPWQNEPDKVQWTDLITGIPCLAVRSNMGNWCGYAGIPEGHPWYKADRWDINPHVSVHGGLNYSSHCQEGDESQAICHIPAPGEPDNVWWIGFDCGHAWDMKPGTDAMLRSIDPTWEKRRAVYNDVLQEVYRDLAYVQGQCEDLASQIHQEGM